MDRSPAAYIRRSFADSESPGDISRDVQESAIREMAHRDGYNGDVVWYVDWARSADEEKEAKRTAFRAMLAAVEAGKVAPCTPTASTGWPAVPRRSPGS